MRSMTFGEHIAVDLNTSGALAVLFDLVRELNTAIDAGELGATTPRPCNATFQQLRPRARGPGIAQAEDEHPPIPVEEIEQTDRCQTRSAAGAQFRRGRSYPQGSR